MNKTDYEKLRENQIKNMQGKQKLLLHSCCAPCSSGVIDRLLDFFDITIYFYNPNMDSEQEYNKRASEQVRFISQKYGDQIKVIIPDYDGESYLKQVAGLQDEKEGGLRCEKCFYLRFKRCAEYAKQNGYNYLTSTLTVSPYKNANLVNKQGETACNEVSKVTWVYSDFKKANGYINSINISKEYNLYRQDYCGCIFSLNQSLKRKSGAIG